MRSFDLDQYSDRELVSLIADIADVDGFVTTEEVAKRVGLDANHVRSVASRFAWMRRYGIMERTLTGPRRWRLTAAGRDMATAHVSASLQHTLASLGDAQIVMASHALATRFQRAGQEHATMIRREWQREIQRRRNRQ